MITNPTATTHMSIGELEIYLKQIQESSLFTLPNAADHIHLPYSLCPYRFRLLDFPLMLEIILGGKLQPQTKRCFHIYVNVFNNGVIDNRLHGAFLWSYTNKRVLLPFDGGLTFADVPLDDVNSQFFIEHKGKCLQIEHM